jgi:hypothetical protein
MAAKASYIQKNNDAFGVQLNTFDDNIGSYPQFGLTSAQQAAIAADAPFFNNVNETQTILQNNAKASTTWRDAVRYGNSTATAPTFTALPAAVPAVAPGIEQRFRAVVQQIKNHPAYNEAIGNVLGIEGTVQTGPDMTAIQPVIDATATAGGVIIGWGFGGNGAYLDALELEVDRNDGKGFVTLTTDSTPNYTDTTPFPAAATKWTYRAIYRVNDARVGQWSAAVSVMVG